MGQKVYEKLDEQIKACKKCNLYTVLELDKKEEVRILERRIIGEEEPEFSYVPLYVPRDEVSTGEDKEKKSAGAGEKRRFIFQEPVAGRERLLIFGGGHIAKELCAFAARVGFNVWVAEERPEFSAKERFPDAERVICAPFSETFSLMNITDQDFVAIVTRGHSYDGDCLFYILTHIMPRYLGMIGSRSRVQAQFALFKSRGIPGEKLKRVHNPIGLAIHAVTPEEIAVSITAELILYRRAEAADTETGGAEQQKKTIRTDLDGDIIGQIAGCKKPAAVATILWSEGSCPRKAGAKMLIFPDGSICGSIGGGFGERQVIDRALPVIGTGKAVLIQIAMDKDAAAREGMACGGKEEVLIEDLKIRFSDFEG